jgi:protein-S-isoprenylcysteine O-methyltransferase Ste14
MNELLRALGKTPGLWKGCAVFSPIGLVMTAVLTVRLLLDRFVGWEPAAVQLAIWGGWFCWQGWFFARNRERYLRQDPATAYRKAFYRNIVFGLGVWMAQMLTPVETGFHAGTLTQSWAQLAIGVPLLLFGLLLLGAGFRAIGLAGAGFVYEYFPRATPMLKRCIYSYIRHPLFLGGVFASLGLGCLFEGPSALVLGLVNLAILPVYGRLEDARQLRIFGADYREYCDNVAGFVPLPALRKWAAEWLVVWASRLWDPREISSPARAYSLTGRLDTLRPSQSVSIP